MPLSFVDVSSETAQPWGEVLETVADCIKLHVKSDDTGARVYPFWVYEIDIATLLGKVVAQMYATEGTSNGKVHCWTLGISDAKPILSPVGDSPIIGGIAFEWDLTIDVWGLWSYDGTRTTQNLAFDEARLVAAALFRNAETIVAGIPLVSAVKNLSYTALQPTPFSDGKLYTVARRCVSHKTNILRIKNGVYLWKV